MHRKNVTDVQLTSRPLIFESETEFKNSGEKLVDIVMVDGFGLGDTVSTAVFVHIRTSLDVWTGSANLCNSRV